MQYKNVSNMMEDENYSHVIEVTKFNMLNFRMYFVFALSKYVQLVVGTQENPNLCPGRPCHANMQTLYKQPKLLDRFQQNKH